MYGALWRALPGPWPVRLLLILILLAAVATACVIWIYPWIDATFLQTSEEVTVGLSASGGGLGF